MKFPFIKNDPMLTLVYLTVVVCLTKFLFEGMTVTLAAYTFTLAQSDAGTYAALLAPILGAHGYVTVRTPPPKLADLKKDVTPDNPDA